MNRRCPAWVGVLILTMGIAAPAIASKPQFKTVTLAIRHRVLHQLAGQQVVTLNKEFAIGDTDYTAMIVRYVPDFIMNLETRAIVTRSQDPRNPALQIIVKEKGEPQDTTWVMMSLPPHFGRRSLLAFKVMRIDFDGRDAVVADSAQAARELDALMKEAMDGRPSDNGGMSPHGRALTNPHGSRSTGAPFKLMPAHRGDSTRSGKEERK